MSTTGQTDQPTEGVLHRAGHEVKHATEAVAAHVPGTREHREAKEGVTTGAPEETTRAPEAGTAYGATGAPADTTSASEAGTGYGTTGGGVPAQAEVGGTTTGGTSAGEGYETRAVEEGSGASSGTVDPRPSGMVG